MGAPKHTLYCHPRRYFHASLRVPAAYLERFVARQQYIGQLAELLAAVAAYTTFPDLLSARKVIHWIDNTGALAALVKGYSRAPDSCRVVHAFHALNLGFQSRVCL